MSTHLVRNAALIAVAVIALGSSVASAQTSARRSTIASKVIASRSDSSRAVAPRTVSPKVTPAMPRLTAAMEALPAQAGRFVRIPMLRAESIAFVDVRNMFRLTEDQKWFEEAISKHERDMTAMRSALQGSLVLRDVLYEKQLTMQHVVAVEVNPDGRSGTVYFRPE